METKIPKDANWKKALFKWLEDNHIKSSYYYEEGDWIIVKEVKRDP